MRRSLRTKESRKIIGEIHSWALQTKALGESLLRKAVEYMGSLWRGLTIFLDDPKVDIDHNDVERALRAMVVGRKNHYGSKSKRGAEVAAILYSMIESTKLVGINPQDYIAQAVEAYIDGHQTCVTARTRSTSLNSSLCCSRNSKSTTTLKSYQKSTRCRASAYP